MAEGETRAELLGRTQSDWREVNELIQHTADRFGDNHQDLVVLCECGDPRCAELIRVERGLYERIRADGRRFLLRSGHELAEVERVLERVGGLAIVEKFGSAGEVAARHDPRREPRPRPGT